MVCEIIEVTGDPPQPTGKELVLEFSKSLTAYEPQIRQYVAKLVQLLGGKDVYIEDGTKLVVVF